MTDQRTPNEHSLRLAPIEPEEYDALADLFLGDSSLAPHRHEEHEENDQGRTHVGVVVEDDVFEDESYIDLPCPPERVTIEPRESYEAHAESRPHSTDEQADEIIEVDEPAPMPAPAVQVIGRIVPRDDYCEESTEEFDEATIDTNRRPAVEVVLLGHLPVRATLWVRQYACAVARETGETVALVRAAAGSTAVDLITGDRPVETRLAVSIAHALEKAAYLADRVIVRVDESGEPELLERGEVDRVTILTGADETAVVASYRLIKTLTASWEWGDEGVADLRMAVMGGTSEQSADARTKLTHAVESFIDQPIEIVISAGR
ncbi:MAG: hypothetical protein JKY96_05500, partial [Phycisphaerales bacterium]|nr:hypothetical protein [Phycisphaerales bacterium]